MEILGVRIDNLEKQEILEKIEFFLSDSDADKPCTINMRGKFHQIATVNPEFILEAQKNLEFKNILNNSALNVADGVGVWYAFIRNFAYLKARMTGADLMQEILELANEKNLRVFLALHPKGLSSFEEIKTVLKEKYPKLEVVGGPIDPKKDKKWPVMNDCQIVFCNFGFPRQEKFINFIKNDTIRLAMGVGGSFDFLTGKIKRAPKFMRVLGLEWLWRLILEPRYRLGRVFKAVVLFPIRVTLNR